MVSDFSMDFMIFSMSISFLLPVGLFIYFKIKYKISAKATIVGIIIFIVFSQILEKLVHLYVLKINKTTISILKNTVLYALYAGLAAGVFEEVGRYVGFKFLLKNKTEWKDGVAYGIGHGGIEAVILGVFTNINLLVYSGFVNSGILEKKLAYAMHANEIAELKNSLLTTHSYIFGLSGIERVFALCLHILFSLLVLYGIKNNKKIFLLLSIFIHTFVDFSAVFLQSINLSPVIIESVTFLFALISLVFIIKFKALFDDMA